MKTKKLRKKFLSLALVASCLLPGNTTKASKFPPPSPYNFEAKSRMQERYTANRYYLNSENAAAKGAPQTNSTKQRGTNPLSKALPQQKTIPSSQNTNKDHLSSTLEDLYKCNWMNEYDNNIIRINEVKNGIETVINKTRLTHILKGDNTTNEQNGLPVLDGGHTLKAIEEFNKDHEKTDKTSYSDITESNEGFKTYCIIRKYGKDSIKGIFPDTWTLKDLINAIGSVLIENQSEIKDCNEKQEIIGSYKGIFIKVICIYTYESQNTIQIITAYPISPKEVSNDKLKKKAILDIIQNPADYENIVVKTGNKLTCNPVKSPKFEANAIKKENIELTTYENYKKHIGGSLLIYLMKNKKDDLIKTTIEKGLGVSDIDNDKTPLDLAIENNKGDLIKLLIEKGAVIKSTVDLTKLNAIYDGYTLLQLAIEKDNDELVKILIEKGANPNIKGDKASSPLELTFAKLVEILTKKRKDPNGNKASSPLEPSFENKNDVCRLLLDAGAKVLDEYNKDNILIFCLKNNLYELAKNLIEKGANVNVEDPNDGNTPLHIATQLRKTDIVNSLITKGAAINAVNKQGDTPLHIALKERKKDIANLLIQKGANINAVNGQGNNPLHIAAQLGQTDIANLLIEKGANVNAVNNQGDTPLHIAVVNKKADDITKLLIKASGIQLDSKDKNGNTALILAIKQGNFDLAISLLNKNVDITEKSANEAKETPLSLAFSSEKIKQRSLPKSLKNLIIKLKEKNAKTQDGKTAEDLDKERETNLFTEPSKEIVDSQSESSKEEIPETPNNTEDVLKNATIKPYMQTLEESITEENVNSIRIEDKCLLDFAVAGRHYPAAAWLINKKSDTYDSFIKDLFSILGEKDANDFIISLIKIDKFGNNESIDKDYPLHCSLRNKNYAVAQYLIMKASKEDVNRPDASGHNPLYIVVVGNNLKVNAEKANKNKKDKKILLPELTIIRVTNCLLLIKGSVVNEECKSQLDSKNEEYYSPENENLTIGLCLDFIKKYSQIEDVKEFAEKFQKEIN